MAYDLLEVAPLFLGEVQTAIALVCFVFSNIYLMHSNLLLVRENFYISN